MTSPDLQASAAPHVMTFDWTFHRNMADVVDVLAISSSLASPSAAANNWVEKQDPSGNCVFFFIQRVI